MNISDKVLKTLLLDQTTKRPILDNNGQELTTDIFNKVESDLLGKMEPQVSCSQVKEEVETVYAHYLSLQDWTDCIFERELEYLHKDGRYLVSLLDDQGEKIPVNERYAILDQKFKLINDHTNSENQWEAWALVALQNTYGFNDNGYCVLLSRLNVLQDFIDHFIYRFGKEPTQELLETAANIISWNIFQIQMQFDLKAVYFPGTEKIMDWHNGEEISFLDVIS